MSSTHFFKSHLIILSTENRIQEKLHEKSTSGRKRPRIPSPHARHLRKRCTAVSTLRTEIDEIRKIVDLNSEKNQKKRSKVFAELRDLRTRLFKSENQTKKLRRKNKALKSQNKELRNAANRSEILYDKLSVTKKENRELKLNASLNKQNDEQRYATEMCEHFNDKLFMMEETNEELQLEIESLNRQNWELRNAIRSSGIRIDKLIMMEEKNEELQRANESLNHQNRDLEIQLDILKFATTNLP